MTDIRSYSSMQCRDKVSAALEDLTAPALNCLALLLEASIAENKGEIDKAQRKRAGEEAVMQLSKAERESLLICCEKISAAAK